MADKQDKATNETHFLGAVSGQIHTGSGDISIGSSSEGTPTENKTAVSPGGDVGVVESAVAPTRDEMPQNQTLFHGPVTGQVHTGSGDINIDRIVGDTIGNSRFAVPVQAGVDANGDVIVVEPETRKVVRKVLQQEAYQRITEEAGDVRVQKQQIYDHNRSLARQWTLFSLFAAILGFLIILGGVVAFLIGVGNTTAAVITSIASIIPEAAAALFFRQAEIAHRRVDDNQKELVEAGTTHRLIALIETIDNNETQRRLKERMIMQSFGLSTKGQEVSVSTSNEEVQDQ